MVIRIPTTEKKHSVATNSDLFGTINYTKNISLDDEGYIKLSPRTVSVFSERDNGNVRLGTAFGRKSTSATSTEFAVTQAGQKGYWFVFAENDIAFNVDIGTAAATLTEDSHAAWYRNLWTITDDANFYTKASVADTATYTDRGNLTAGKVHFVEVFKNRDTVCITNGEVVSQFDNTYTASTNLTLPTDFETVALAYSNNKMGIATMVSDTASDQNQDAYFFVWDGSSTSAGSGFPIGSDMAIGLVAYKGSWAILTRHGQLNYFNGGGWTELASFPFYFSGEDWGNAFTRNMLGNIMSVEGDLIYININGFFVVDGSNYEQINPQNAGGVWCYDPAVGLYNKYSPSISTAKLISVTSANVNTTTDILTTTSTIPSTGSPIKYLHDKTSQIGGLQTNTIYYVIKHTSTTFSLAASKEDATNGVKVNLTSTGAATNYFFGLEVYDYGTFYATRSGAIASFGKKNAVYNHLIYSSELNDYDSTGNSNHYLITSGEFESRGYFVTPKVSSNNVEDVYQNLFIRYSALKTTDSIIVKYKNKDCVGLPVTTPQGRSSTNNQCSWTSSTVFTTTADLSDAKTVFDAGVELECEVLSGAGAGVMEKITNLTESSGTYTVTLENAVDGASSGRYCDVKIDNWTHLKTITSSDGGNYDEMGVDTPSSWIKFKVELRGVDTTIEEIQVHNEKYK